MLSPSLYIVLSVQRLTQHTFAAPSAEAILQHIPEMPFIGLKNGVNIWYEYYRGGSPVNDLDPSKPTIVLLHAEFTNSEVRRPASPGSHPFAGLY